MSGKVYDADHRMEDIFQHVVSEKKLINEESTSIDIFDIDFFKARLQSLKAAFPEDFFLHAMALKGNLHIFNCSIYIIISTFKSICPYNGVRPVPSHFHVSLCS